MRKLWFAPSLSVGAVRVVNRLKCPTRTVSSCLSFLAWFLALASLHAHSQSVQPTYTYIITNGTVTITEINFPLTFHGPAGPITLPNTIAGLPVTALGSDFSSVFIFYLTSITIPSTVTSIGDFAFEDDVLLTNITFLGNAPSVGVYSFETHAQQQGNVTTAYYMAGTSGWVYDCTLPACGILGVLASDDVESAMLPTINFSVTRTNGLVPLTVQVTPAVTDSQGNPVYRWNWSFGDGVMSTATSPSHTYTNVGTFSITLVETNSDGIPVAGIVGPAVTVSPIFTTLHRFNGSTDGAGPSAGVVLVGSSLYGTAEQGGAGQGGVGYGTVFKVNTDGTGFQVLHAFTNGPDGGYPQGSLLAGGDTLYGSASAGGTNGTGTVFSIKTNGMGFKILHTFGAASNPFSYFYSNSDGGRPASQLALSGQTLYGTASGGGMFGYGTVFSINTDGTSFMKLHDFTGGSDGGQPIGGVILWGNTLYGTTFSGGSAGAGTIFSVRTDGTAFTNLHAFAAASEGGSPSAGLSLSGTTLYGTAAGGGVNGSGTVFAMNTNGTEFRILHSFAPTLPGSAPFYINADGDMPSAQPALSGGALYGTALYGGTYGLGTVFKVNADGTGFADVYNFAGWDDGIIPSGQLTISGSVAYGTAEAAGDCFGTIFSLLLGPATSGSRTLPNPVILTDSLGLYSDSNQIAFTISWATNGSVVVETSTNLHSGIWVPIATNVLQSGLSQFWDSRPALSPAGFYRVRSP